MGVQSGERGKGFHDLVAWQKSMDLVSDVYRVTRLWPKDEQFGLISQVRRAAVSIPSNIAEGFGRFGRSAYRYHVAIAFGSLCELETQLTIAERLDYVDAATIATLRSRLENVRRPLFGLFRSLEEQAS